MQYIEIKLTAGEYARLTKAAAMRGMSETDFLRHATLERCRELSQNQGMIPFPPAPAYAPPAYPAPLAGVGAPVYQMPYPARPGASGEAGEVDRLRHMVAIKRGIDAELIRFAESILSR